MKLFPAACGLLLAVVAADPACAGSMAGGRGTVSEIPDSMWANMQGKSWHNELGCPAREKLVLVRLPHFDFTGKAVFGEMIVARSVAGEVLDIFERLFKAGFPIERMEPVYRFGGSDNASMAANNTSAFNCRRTPSGKRLSRHSFGTAIDVNPVQNPYVTRKTTLPPAGRAYDSPKERRADVQGLIRHRDIVTKAFAKSGWKWGGLWRSLKDYQHFSRDGR